MLEFPLFTINMNYGSIPFLQPLQIEKLMNLTSPLLFSFEYLLDNKETLKLYKQQTNKNLLNFFGFSSERPYFICQRNVFGEIVDGKNDMKNVSLWNNNGRSKVNDADYDNLLKILKNDMKEDNFIIELLHDDEYIDKRRKKRMVKAMKRNENFRLNCLKNEKNKDSLIFPLIGNENIEESRLRYMESIFEETKDFKFYSISSIISNEKKIFVNERNESILPELTRKMKIVMNKKDNHICLFQGIYNLYEIFQLIESGVDVFNSLYPFVLADHGLVLNFSSISQETNLRKIINLNDVIEFPKLEFNRLTKHLYNFANENSSGEISIFSKRCTGKKEKIDENCQCYCCRERNLGENFINFTQSSCLFRILRRGSTNPF
ncbi:hypothetical protein SNEBB_009055 [Seison nebaliae]|nr:hypothetical protein SNEBB_009055 [Seison nebaliae]